MLNIYVLMGTPTKCATCGKPFHRGQRVITDGTHDFDTCECARTYKRGVTNSPFYVKV